MKFSEKMIKDPDCWVDIKTIFPLLLKKKYYKFLDYGYACGTESGHTSVAYSVLSKSYGKKFLSVYLVEFFMFL